MAYYLVYDPNNGNRLVSHGGPPDPTDRATAQGYTTIDVVTEPNFRLNMWDAATQSMVIRPQPDPPPAAVTRIENHPFFLAAEANFPSLDAQTQAAVLQIIIDAS